MNFLTNLLTTLYKSKTITPSYKIPQILYTILLIGKEPNGIGRYKIKNHIGLGEGATKTLLTRLREAEIIHLEQSRQRGHALTTQGKKIYLQLLQMISYPRLIHNRSEDKKNLYVIGEVACYVRVKKRFYFSTPNLQLGINQRDEAIKIGGTGATCLIYDGQHMVFPGQESENQYPTSIDGINTTLLDEGDIIIIGGGNAKNSAILATLAAAYSVLTEKS